MILIKELQATHIDIEPKMLDSYEGQCMNDDNEEMTHAYFFYTFFAMWALNCYQEIACLPFPAID